MDEKGNKLDLYKDPTRSYNVNEAENIKQQELASVLARSKLETLRD